MPRSVSPTQALRLLTRSSRAPRAETVPVESAAGRFLAAPLPWPPAGTACSTDSPETRRAGIDGFAVSVLPSPGDEIEVSGTLLRPESWPQEALSSGRALRVECGVVLGDEVAAVLPVSWATIIGSSRVRADHTLLDGHGIVGPASGPDLQLPSGTRIGPRLQSQLLDRGQQEVLVSSRLRVGVLSAGADLTDVRIQPPPGQRRDLNGFWLSEALSGPCLDVVPLGISSSRPEDLREALLRARHRSVDLLVVSGGLGDGVEDRTAEGLKDFGCRVVFERLILEGCRHVLLAKDEVLDVLGLSGAPLPAAAGFDIFLVPHLLSRLGAPPELWDWTRRRWPFAWIPGEPPNRTTAGSGDWRLLFARVRSPAEAAAESLEVWSLGSPFQPYPVCADGWALVEPDSRGDAPLCAHFWPVSG